MSHILESKLEYWGASQCDLLLYEHCNVTKELSNIIGWHISILASSVSVMFNYG